MARRYSVEFAEFIMLFAPVRCIMHVLAFVK